MNLLKLLAAGFVIACVQLPAVAATAPTRESSESEEPATPFFDALNAGQYAQALKIVEKLKPDPANPDARSAILAMRAAALLGLGREKQSDSLFEQANALAPRSEFPLFLQLQMAFAVNRPKIALRAFDQMIARFPDQVRQLDRDLVGFLLQNEDKGQKLANENRRIALAQIGYGADGADGDYFAFSAMETLLKRGDIAAARDLLQYIDEPQLIENMLVLRTFAPLWAEAGARAGPHLEKIRASSVETAQRAFGENPDDASKLSALVRALRHAGRLQEAIAYRSHLPATTADMAKASEDMGWAINEVALAFHELGRADEADQLFALLNEAPMEKDWWRVSMKINRLELLVADGKYREAEPLVEPTAKAKGSPYAEQLVRRLRFCTLSGLGRKDEAAKLVPDLLAHSDDAPHATVDALLCAGDAARAETVALAALAKEGNESDFVRAMQPYKLTSDDPSKWDSGWKELRARPAVAAAYGRIGRDIPPEYLVDKPALTPAR